MTEAWKSSIYVTVGGGGVGVKEEGGTGGRGSGGTRERRTTINGNQQEAH